MKKICLIIVALFFFFGSNTLAGELIVGGEYSPPYLFMRNGKIVGIDAEIIKQVLDESGVNYRIVILPWQRCWKMLERGTVDIGIGIPKNREYDAHVHYPATFSRNMEFVIFTNKETKKQHDATSLYYIRKNYFRVGIIRGQSYHERFWNFFPWQNVEENRYHVQIEPANNIEINLKKLNANRINAFPSDKTAGLYTAGKLGLKKIIHYDFVIFYTTTFNVFSRNSKYKSEKYQDITALMKAYDRKLEEFHELPEFMEIFNWNWDTPYISKKRVIKKETTGKTVNIGFLAALSGPDAGWGKPGLTGNQMFIDEVNARGGLLVGGVRYPLKMHIYDDEGDGAKALKGARELVEKHDVKFISAIGGADADATHPYLTKKKVIYASLIATDIRPDRPYLLAGGDVTPRIDMLRPWYHRNKNPKLKKWAVVSQDDPIGRACQAWEVGAAVAEGWEVVYDRHFPLDTSDFSKVADGILATDPDVVSLNLTWPDFVTLILEQLYIKGYRGEISGNYMDVEANLKKVPVWFHEGAVDSFPLFNDPFWGYSSIQHRFYDLWKKRYGPGAPEDLKRDLTGIDWDHVIMLRIWALGAQLAESFDPDRIIKALRAQKSFPTILGNAKMTGREMWGIDNMVSPPIPINETKDGVKRIQTIKGFDEWFQAHKETIIDVVKSKGLFWNQQK
ncbi:MAG: ABC transporter substrate-binding protein [Desulfobacteraceae bacterium]|nr:ABC transporter substrate-binding protein [Desulfobacteraceae bacterium]